MTYNPGILIVGHAVRNQTPHGLVIGGTVVYGALVPIWLRHTDEIVTRIGSELDSLGVADVEAVAYLRSFCEMSDPLVSATLANCVPGSCVETEGVRGISTMPQVEKCFAFGP